MLFPTARAFSPKPRLTIWTSAELKPVCLAVSGICHRADKDCCQSRCYVRRYPMFLYKLFKSFLHGSAVFVGDASEKQIRLTAARERRVHYAKVEHWQRDGTLLRSFTAHTF